MGKRLFATGVHASLRRGAMRSVVIMSDVKLKLTFYDLTSDHDFVNCPFWDLLIVSRDFIRF